MANISASELLRLRLPVAPLKHQGQSLRVLEKANVVRRKRKEAITLTEELLRSVFLEMFGDPVTNPKGWPRCKLQDLCHRITDGTHVTPKFEAKGVPFLFIRNLVNGRLNFDTDKFISRAVYEELTRRCPIENGDVLYATVGSYGDAAVVESSEPFCFQRHLAHLKPSFDKVTPPFLHALLRSPGVKAQADRRVRGVAQPTLNLGELRDFDVFLPAMTEQRRFGEVVTRVRELAEVQAASARAGDDLFSSLIQRVFRGELTRGGISKVRQIEMFADAGLER